jgi:hypothetical protein
MDPFLLTARPPHARASQLGLSATLLALAILAATVLSGCDSRPEAGSATCRANLGSVEILEVWGEEQTLYVAGRMLHHCQTPSVMTLRFTFLDIDGQVLDVQDATPTGATALAAVTPQDFEWSTPMIDGVDAVTAMVVRLAAAPVALDEPQ